MTIARLNTTASRYLSAYLDLASSSSDDFVRADFEALSELCALPEFSALIKNPLVKPEQHLAILEKLFPLLSLHKVTQNFLSVLATNGRFSELPALTKIFPRFHADRAGQPLIDVTTPKALSDDEKAKLIETLKSTYQTDIFIEFDTDPSLLGGIVVKVGSEMLDTTLKSKLNRMQTQLKGTG